jgi:MFS family permease
LCFIAHLRKTKDAQSSAQTSMISTAALVGAMFGQLIFGGLADAIGRRVIFITTLTLVSFGSLISAFVDNTDTVSICELAPVLAQPER